MRPFALVLVALPIWTVTAAAQGPGTYQSGRRVLLPRAREIALARSAAPPTVSDSATIYVLGDQGY
jgi:hypothetical protein